MRNLLLLEYMSSLLQKKYFKNNNKAHIINQDPSLFIVDF